MLTSPLRLLGPAVTPGTLPPAPAPLAIPIAPNLADTIDGVYIAVEPWVRYGFQVAADVLGWVPWVGWLSGQIMVFYDFGQRIVASGVFNFTDWLRGQGGVIENLIDFGIDVGLAFVWLGIDEYNYFLPPLPPGLPRPPIPPVQGPFLALETLMEPTATSPDEVANPASDLVDAITRALVDANETFFDVVSGVTELGLFDIAEPVLRDLRLDVVADQIDINYFDLLKPATIQEVDGISELLTVPRNYLTRVLEGGEGPLEALDAEAEFVADTVVTRVGNAGDVVEKYVDKQLGNLPIPGGTADVASVPASARTALKAVNRDNNEGGDDAAATTTQGRQGHHARREVARRRSAQGGQGHRAGARAGPRRGRRRGSRC